MKTRLSHMFKILFNYNKTRLTFAFKDSDVVGLFGEAIRIALVLFSSAVCGTILGFVSRQYGMDKFDSNVMALLTFVVLDGFIKLIIHDNTECPSILYIKPIHKYILVSYFYFLNFFTWENMLCLCFVVPFSLMLGFIPYSAVIGVLLISIANTSLVIVSKEVINFGTVSQKVLVAINVLLYILCGYFYVNTPLYVVVCTLLIITITLYVVYWRINILPVQNKNNLKNLCNLHSVSIWRLLIIQITRTNVKIILLPVAFILIGIVFMMYGNIDNNATPLMLSCTYIMVMSYWCGSGFTLESAYFDLLLCIPALIKRMLIQIYIFNISIMCILSLFIFGVTRELMALNAGFYAMGVLLPISFLSYTVENRRWDTLKERNPKFKFNKGKDFFAMLLMGVFLCLYLLLNSILNQESILYIVIAVFVLGCIISPLWFPLIYKRLNNNKYNISSEYRKL